MSDAEQVRRYRFLVGGLVFFVLTHGLGMLTMATLLRPGMDAASFSAAERMAYVAEHPWAWRLGWSAWQGSALSDLWVAVALVRWLAVRTPSPGLGWAWLAVPLVLVAAIPEQWAEAMLVSTFIDEARSADLATAEASWTLYAQLTGAWAAGFYTLMTAAWMLAVRRVCDRGAWPAPLEVGLVALFLASVVFTGLATQTGGADSAQLWLAAGAANGVAFTGLLAYSLAMANRLAERQRQDVPDRTDAAFALRWPRGRALRWLAPLAADGARDLARVLSRALPFPVLQSDITDVVYLTWLVRPERVAHLVPDGLELDVRQGWTALTVLTYRHGGFGPRLLGPLRRFMPSPVQSNWRLHLAPREPGRPQDAVLFLKNVLDHPIFVIGSRLASDGLPSHLPARMEHRRDGGTVRTRIEPGDGSAADLTVTVQQITERRLPAPFTALGATWEEVVAYLVPQQLSIRTHPAVGLRSESRIELGNDLERVCPAEVRGAVESEWLAPLVGEAPPFCFVVPEVRFLSTGERWSPMPAPSVAPSPQLQS